MNSRYYIVVGNTTFLQHLVCLQCKNAGVGVKSSSSDNEPKCLWPSHSPSRPIDGLRRTVCTKDRQNVLTHPRKWLLHDPSSSQPMMIAKHSELHQTAAEMFCEIKVSVHIPSRLATTESKPVPAPISSTALSFRFTCCWLFSRNWHRAIACRIWQTWCNSCHLTWFREFSVTQWSEDLLQARSELQKCPWTLGWWCHDLQSEKTPSLERCCARWTPRCSSFAELLLPSLWNEESNYSVWNLDSLSSLSWQSLHTVKVKGQKDCVLYLVSLFYDLCVCGLL